MRRDLSFKDERTAEDVTLAEAELKLAFKVAGPSHFLKDLPSG